MNEYIAEYGKAWGIAVLVPQPELLSQINGALALALGQEIAAEDMVILAKIARVLQQASLLSGDDQGRYLRRELSERVAGQNGKWTLTGIKALIAQWIATHELVAASA